MSKEFDGFFENLNKRSRDDEEEDTLTGLEKLKLHFSGQGIFVRENEKMKKFREFWEKARSRPGPVNPFEISVDEYGNVCLLIYIRSEKDLKENHKLQKFLKKNRSKIPGSSVEYKAFTMKSDGPVSTGYLYFTGKQLYQLEERSRSNEFPGGGEAEPAQTTVLPQEAPVEETAEKKDSEGEKAQEKNTEDKAEDQKDIPPTPYFKHEFHTDRFGEENLFIWEVGQTKTYASFSASNAYIAGKLKLKAGDAGYDARFEKYRLKSQDADFKKYPRFGYPTYWFKKTPGWDKADKNAFDSDADFQDLAEFKTTDYNEKDTGFFLNLYKFDPTYGQKDEPVKDTKGNDYNQYIGEYVDSQPAKVKAPLGIILHDSPSNEDPTYNEIKNSAFKDEFTIPQGDKVEIIARGNEDNPDWVLVRSGNTIGWIPESTLEKEAPVSDPLGGFGKDYVVREGEGLEKILQENIPVEVRREKDYDPRDYAIAFIILNGEDKWYFKDKEYTIKDFGKDLFDSEKGDQRYVYQRIELYEGAKVKIPSKKFVDELKAAGVIGERSETDQAIVDFAHAAIPFLEGMYDGFVQAGKDAATEMWNMLRDILSGDLFEQFKQLYEFLQNASINDLKEIFTTMASDFDSKWNNADPEVKWHFRGEIAGQIIFEIVLAMVSGGGGLATKLGKLKQLEKFGNTIKEFEKRVLDKIPGNIKDKLKKVEVSPEGGEKAIVPPIVKDSDETMKEAFDRRKREFESDFEKTKDSPEFLEKLEARWARYKGKLTKEEYIERFQTLYKNRHIGKIGEETFQLFQGGEKLSRKTSRSWRHIDNFKDGIAREIKSGIVKDSKDIRTQILKDIEMLTDTKNPLKKVEWHFFQGADPKLVKFLEDAKQEFGSDKFDFKIY